MISKKMALVLGVAALVSCTLSMATTEKTVSARIVSETQGGTILIPTVTKGQVEKQYGFWKFDLKSGLQSTKTKDNTYFFLGGRHAVVNLHNGHSIYCTGKHIPESATQFIFTISKAYGTYGKYACKISVD